MLHSNLLGRLGNGLLKFVVLVVMVCNVSGAFAETISTNTTLSSATTYDDDVTVNSGVTLTINSEVTIQGNLINNGGTIIVGEGGVLTVTGNVTNRSAYSTTEYTESSPSTSETTKSTGNNKRNLITTTTITRTPKIIIGSISVLNGGSITINNDFSNASNLSITSTESDKISKIVVKGDFTNTTANITGYNTVQTTTTTQPQTRKNSLSDWNNNGTSSTTSNSKIYSISATTVGSINLSNGYLVVKGSMELQDNSVINYNTASSLGEDIQSTINVSGSVIQAENADINLDSGAKGKLIVAETYTDNTTTDGNANHPWEIDTDTKNFSMSNGFDLFTKEYVSARINDKFNELTERLSNISTELSALYRQALYSLGIALLWLTDDINALIEEQSQKEAEKKIYETIINFLANDEDGARESQIATESAAVSTLLPIELSSFTATATDYGFEFNWVTASENENDYFTLEYSIDGVDFSEIDYVHGAGTTSETSEYTYRWDEAPEFDVVYFRLKQTDYNGEYLYSDVIAASRKKSSGANGTFRYGPLNLQIQDGELRYIVK